MMTLTPSPLRISATLSVWMMIFSTAMISVPASAEEKNPAEIFSAIKAKGIDGLKGALDANPDAWKTTNKVGNQPLHEAARGGNNEAVGLLLERGADVGARGFSGWTALHYAARGGHPETCRILLVAGADRNAICDLKRKPITGASNAATRDILKNFRVVKPGAEEFVAAASAGNLEKAKALLGESPDLLDAVDGNGRTAAIEAAANNRVELLQWLVGAGADVNLLAGEREESALYLASLAGHVEAVELLLKSGVEVNPPPTDEPALTATPSPLSEASDAFTLNERFIPMFAEALTGGDTEEKRKDLAATAGKDEPFGGLFKGCIEQVDEPLRSRKAEIVSLLIAAGAKPDIKGRGLPLCGSVLSGQPENVRLLLGSGADPNLGTVGLTPLISAFLVQHPDELIKVLLDNGADPLRKGGDSPLNKDGTFALPLMEKSALSIAAEIGSVKLFEQMIDHLDLGKLSDQQKAHVLTSAARNPGCMEVVLPAGFDVNLANEKKQTALHIAANNEGGAVRLLLEAGADPQVKDYAGFTPLHNAAEQGLADNVRMLLEKDASLIEVPNDMGETPLMSVGFKGDVKTASLLIEKGANVNASVKASSRTPLMGAAFRGRAELVETLINAGADVNATSDLSSVLGCAAMCGASIRQGIPKEGFQSGSHGTEDDYLHIAELLIAKGADVDQEGTKEKAGMPPLSWAIGSGSVSMVKFLLKKGADPEKRNEKMFGNTPVFAAIDAGNAEVFELIMGLDIDVNTANNNKLTLLHFAAGSDQPGMVRSLIKKGARINAKQKDGITPLWHAVYFNKSQGVRALLEAGADKAITDNRGITPLQVAESTQNNAMIRILTTVRKK
jgi:ankyrin repeat protein